MLAKSLAAKGQWSGRPKRLAVMGVACWGAIIRWRMDTGAKVSVRLKCLVLRAHSRPSQGDAGSEKFRLS